jgi:5-methylcytosine-specific restriction endonuclease McrA
MMMKRCSKGDRCLTPNGPLLPVTEFYKDRTKKGGLASSCKKCSTAGAELWRVNNPERHTEVKQQYYLQHKEDTIERNRQWRAENPERRAENRRQEYERNRERAIEETRQWCQEHTEQAKANKRRHRARKRDAAGQHTAADIQVIYASQRGLCWWCSCELKDNYHVDHRVPLARGGSDAPENLVLTCPHCNISKGSKLPSEWAGRLL